MIFLKVAIVGSRKFDDAEKVYGKICENIPRNCTEIVSGGAKGVDTLAQRYAEEHGVFMKVFLPEYEKFGKAATLIRNTEIVKYSDYIFVFIHDDSSGSVDTAKKCLELGKPFSVIYI